MKDCKLWDGKLNAQGYGYLWTEGKYWLAHRWVWTQTNGPIPEGMVIRHRCDNPPCVKLQHLLIGTMADNSHDMVERNRHNPHQASKTECPQGHQYSPENTYVPPNRNERQCRTCIRDRAREKYRRLHPDANLRKP